MNIHEYQAKRLLVEYGVAVPKGHPARSVTEVNAATKSLGGSAWMVKAQIHAGGRGKAGGVKRAETMEDAVAIADSLLGTQLVTPQTMAAGQAVDTVLIETITNIKNELYFSMLVDREQRRVAVIASAAGGVNIEEVAATNPNKIITETIDPITGLQPYQIRCIGFALGLDKPALRQLASVGNNLYRLFMDKDLSMLELNPLVVTTDGNLLALDAKITFDDNAMFRHPRIAELEDRNQRDEKEVTAERFDLNYITLEGNIACMVNGAGLAMGTMDTIKLHGGEPANFLDVGGSTTAKKVAEAFKLIVSDPKVQAIFVNIFGGIVRCDLIAEGILQAVTEVGVTIPVVVRLEGTNVDQGQDLLARSTGLLPIITASSLSDGAIKAIAAAKQHAARSA